MIHIHQYMSSPPSVKVPIQAFQMSMNPMQWLGWQPVPYGDGDDEDKGGFDRGEFNPSGQPIDVDDEDEEAKEVLMDENLTV